MFDRLGIWFFYRQPAAPKRRTASEWLQGKHTHITDSPWVEVIRAFRPMEKTSFSPATRTTTATSTGKESAAKPREFNAELKGSDTMPAFSADGSSSPSVPSATERNIHNEETGENVRRVSDIGFHPSWSPDGAKIVVSDRASPIHTNHTVPNSSLYVIDVKNRK